MILWDFLEASFEAKSAALNSDVRVEDYTMGGTLVRSFMSGVGQVVTGLADTGEWLNELTGGALGKIANPLQIPGLLLGVDLIYSIVCFIIIGISFFVT